ncbi:MAG: response regulator [Caldilineaceae bacterium]|nr:response regulator [Caldilineaceae bacterium]
MHQQATYFAIPLLLGSTVAVALLLLAWQRIGEPGARAFMIAVASVALWSFAYAFEVMNNTLAGKLPWHSLIYMASSLLPAFWLIFLLQQEERRATRMRLWIGLLLIEPILYTLLTWTNDRILPGMTAPHHLLWRTIAVSTDAGLPLLVLDRAPGFYLHTIYTYSLVLLSMFIAMRLLRRESSTLSRGQVILLVGGIFAPIMANAVYLLGLNPLPINLTPFALVTMSIAVGWFAFRFELWDLIPAAHTAIFAQMHEGVIVLNQKNVVIDLNPAAAQLIGCSKEAATNLAVEQLLAQWSGVAALKQVLQEPNSGTPLVFELQWPAPEPCYLELSVSELRSRRHQLNGHLLTLRDITRRQEMEQALQNEHELLAQRVAERTADLREANAELERAARLKDEFMASMSHELRTPLNTILGLSEALQEQIYGGLTLRQKRALVNIEESGRHLLSLINDVLDVSKIDAGKLKLEAGPVPVDALCQSALNFIKQSAVRRQQTLTLELDPTVRLVYGDERRLKQILVNLLSNAVKFTPNGGQIGLRVQGDANEEVVQFVVWDNGVGIAQADMARLFEPFVQLDSRLARQYDGSGLGLALVYRMTKLHGGSVSVSSEVGQGSQFIVSLPWQTQDQLPLSATNLWMSAPRATLPLALKPHDEQPWSSLSVKPAQHKVFVVEDNETNAYTLADYLQAHGYEVKVAHNGIDALAQLRETKPDLILMDIQMPGLDGLAVMQQVRKEVILQNVPIVVLTALAMPGDRDRCLAAGADEYLSKPVSLQRLFYLIESYCRQPQPVSQKG